MSDAKVHSFACIPMRRQTNGVPLEPAMTTEKRVDVAPLLRLRVCPTFYTWRFNRAVQLLIPTVGDEPRAVVPTPPAGAA